MSSNLVRNLRSVVETDEVLAHHRSYIDRFDKIRTISQFYSEDSAMALVNMYRNILLGVEKDFTAGRIDVHEFQRQKTQIERETHKLQQ